MSKLRLWLRFGAGEPIEKIEDYFIEKDKFDKVVTELEMYYSGQPNKAIRIECGKNGMNASLVVLAASVVLIEIETPK